MTRILVINNYPLDQVWEEVSMNEKPDHHLYGINYFHQKGFEVDLIPFKSSRFLQKLNDFYKNLPLFIPLGDFDQQWSCLQRLNQADLIYTPCQTQAYFLSYLRALKLIKTPIVSVAHHYLNRGRLSILRYPFVKLLVKGVDAFPSLSSGVARQINEIFKQSYKSQLITWGPDANFYPTKLTKGRGIIAAGRTGRDFYTFGMAASQTKIEANVICLERDYSKTFQRFSDNVVLRIQSNTDYMKYPKLLEIYANSRAIAIPLFVGNGTSLSGLTSLMDALGMGKPVIMTRHPLIDLDIEAEGIGKWVEPGDISGWKNAIEFFENNEDEALEMGKRARKLVDNGLNSLSFANQIINIFERVLNCKAI